MSENRVNQPIEYKTQGSRVYAQGGGSYNCPNIITARELCQKLNNYEKIAQQSKNTEKTLDTIQKGIIQLQMTLTILQDDLNKIKQELNI